VCPDCHTTARVDPRWRSPKKSAPEGAQSTGVENT
jgi:hypothetical protein